MKPKFSVIIPTRNRGHLLSYALMSALSQTIDDYEIIISDNHSSDDTPQIVKDLGGTRTRYFRTSKPLSMPDSWEFALGKASGEWITFVSDDCAISSHLLEAVSPLLNNGNTKVVSWGRLSNYFHPTWQDDSQRNTLIYHPFNGKCRRINSQALLERWFKLIPDPTAPVMLNSFCHYSLVETIRKNAGRFFFSPCPDVSSSTAIAASTEHYTYLDLPLGLNGLAKESIGVSQATAFGEAASEFHREFEEEIFLHTPLKIPLVGNYVMESILRVKEAHKIEGLNISPELYYWNCYLSLADLQEHGVDVSTEKRQFFSIVAKQPLSVKISLYWNILTKGYRPSKTIHDLRNKLRRSINASNLLSALESKMREKPVYGQTVSGAAEGFSNIFEAMQYLDHRVFGNGRPAKL